MEYSKHKDAPPEQTTANIKSILDSLGVEMAESVLNAVEGLYSVRLEDRLHGWGVNGKGTTLAYCMASGYGEAMERFQSNYAYDTHGVSQEAKDYLDFVRAPDEERGPLASIRERAPAVWQLMRDAWERGGEARDDERMAEVWRALVGDEVSFVPYYALGSQKTVCLPDYVVSYLDGSNGLASGNTPEEALCQGLSEVLERYACGEIHGRRLVPPPIERAYIAAEFPVLEETIRRIEALGSFHICIRDASMGRGYPVVAVALIDQAKQRYQVKYGAHPSFAIALERCLTELLQGYTPGVQAQDERFLSRWQAGFVPYDSVANRYALYRGYAGTHPDSFFAGVPSWHFEPWPTDVGFTNAQGIRTMADMLLEIGGEVYIRDMGYLSVPTYRIFVPNVTGHPNKISTQLLRDLRMRARLLSLSDAYCDLTADERAEAIAFLGSIDTEKNIDLVYQDNVPAPLVHAALLCDAGQPLAAAAILRELNVETNQYRCAASDMELAQQGVGTSERDALLTLFYGERCAKYAKLNWRGDSMVRNLFRSPLRRLVRKDAVSKNSALEQWIATNTLHMRVKERMAAGLRDQAAIGNLFAAQDAGEIRQGEKSNDRK